MRLGIDASNLRRGGGVTHLVEWLRAADPAAHGFTQAVVWAPDATLARLPARPWLSAERVPKLNGPLPLRVFWQSVTLNRIAAARSDILFVPGGLYGGSFRPFVTMFRNLLPFSRADRVRYGLSVPRLRLALLRRAQAATFRRAAGVIYLNEFARHILTAEVGHVRGAVAVIPHGVNDAFRQAPRAQRAIDTYSNVSPFRLLYVSPIEFYKHQNTVATAIAELARRGLPVALDLVGGAFPPALRILRATLARVDPRGEIIRCIGPIAHEDLPRAYHRADGFIFASSCENMPNILLEAMAAGLPIASSNRASMPEILGDAGVYFDPESAGSIATALEPLLRDPQLRERLAARAAARAGAYSWARSAGETLAFLAQVARAHPSAWAGRTYDGVNIMTAVE